MGNMQRSLTALAVLCAACAEQEPTVSEGEQAFSESIHENEITADALGSFLRSHVFSDIKDEHSGFSDSTASDVKWVHADSCAFDETIQQINAHLADAIANMVPGASVFDPWSATDDFGRVLHPIQDFYSHSNWVELGFPQFDDPSTSAVEISGNDLVDFGTRLAAPDRLGFWQTPTRSDADGQLGTVRGDILMVDMVRTPLRQVDGTGALDIDGTPTAVAFNPTWSFGLLPHPTIAGAPGYVPGVDVNGDAMFTPVAPQGDGLPIPVMTSGQDFRLLISAIGGRPVTEIVGNQCDPFRRDSAGAVIEPRQVNTCDPPITFNGTTFEKQPDDYSCIAYHGSRFALTHDGSDRSELNKDKPSEAPTRHPKAWALAYLQTQWEWCRFVAQTGQWNGDGPVLSLWVKEGASPNPLGTPCGADDGRGPMGVTVTVSAIEVLDDKETPDDAPGELNFSLALYDNASAFHRLTKSKSAEVIKASDGQIINPQLAPVTQCVGRADRTFRVALHGWDDDDVFIGSGDFNNYDFLGSSMRDDALVGFTETFDASGLPANPLVRESSDMRVTFRITRAPDLESDGLDECGEAFFGTNPLLADTESDGLTDGIEVNGANPTNPLIADTDGDGLDDGEEDANRNGAWDPGETNPNNADTDGDLLSDGIEVEGNNPTNPLASDSDNDGLGDGKEDANHNGNVDLNETNPNDADSDDDLLSDGLEVAVGTNPLDADSDDDGVIDGKDTDWIETAVAALPDSVFSNPNQRDAMLHLLADVEKLASRGNVNGAREKLQTLRLHADGCGAISDPNDWILDCAVQIRIRALIDVLLANL